MERLLGVLYPYQRRIVSDASRFKLLNCSRQCGKSTVFAAEAAIHCALTPGDKWVALSRGERQVVEWISKAAEWGDFACHCARTARGGGINVSCSAKREEVVFSNGSRIIGIPANADTARGYSANVILDEFAYHQHAEKMWAAVFPYITNSVSHEWKIRVGSTVAGRANMFWKLFAERNSVFRKYRITVEQAVAEGMPIDIPMLRRAIGDPDIWRQEYECIPVEGTTTLIGYDLIHAAQSEDASRESPLALLDAYGRNFFLGVDIGRKHDITVIWCAELHADGRKTTRFVKELRHADFEAQQTFIVDCLSRRGVRRACIDATGIGAQLAEAAYKRYPGKVEQCVFTAPFKAEIYIEMQREFQAGTILIPFDDTENPSASIEEDIHNVQRVFTSNGSLLFYAPTNDDGHSDRASALALCLRAARNSSSGGCRISSPASPEAFSELARERERLASVGGLSRLAYL